MKKLWLLIPALLIAGLVFMGCPPDGGGGEEPPEDIEWSLSANGAGEDNVGTENTTQITITFDAEPTGLVGQNISITGGPATIQGQITGSGTTRVVPVNVTSSGTVSVSINKTGIVVGPKTVTVWKEGDEKLIGYTAVANGASNTETSTSITFTFDEAVTELSSDDITITAGAGANGGDASKNDLTGSGTTRVLSIIVSKQGPVTVSIDKEGIYAGNTTVQVYMEVVVGPPAIPEDNQTASLKWHRLEIDHSDDDAEKQAENEAMGKGLIIGEDFAAIVAAAAFQGTYLRIYLDETAVPSNHNGWGIGALGNILNNDGIKDGGVNLVFNATAPGGYAYVDILLKTLKSYYADDDGELFVNVWDNAVIRAVLLYEPIPAVPEEELPEGVTELGLPNGDPPGKGTLGSPDITKINNAKPGSYITLYGSGSPGAGWGVGNIVAVINDNWVDKIPLSIPVGTPDGGDFEWQISVAAIKYAFGVTEYNQAQQWATGTITDGVGINIWNCYLTKILLVEPDGGEDPPPPAVLPDRDLFLTVFGEEGLDDNASMDTGEVGDDDVIVAAVESDRDWGNGGADFDPKQPGFRIKIAFTDPIDLTNYDAIKIEWDGIDDEFQQMSYSVTFYHATESSTVIQISGGLKTKTVFYENLGQDIASWSDNDDWDAVKDAIIAIEFYANAIDVGEDWHKLSYEEDDYEGLDMTYSLIEFHGRSGE